MPVPTAVPTLAVNQSTGDSLHVVEKSAVRARRHALRAPLIVALIVSALTGCDNVSWGGADVAVVPPPPKASGADLSKEEAAAMEDLPQGPVLYYVARSSAGAVMIPVAEITGDSLRSLRTRGDAHVYASRFVASNMRQGQEFALFSRGARVGTYVVQSAQVPDQPGCPVQPQALGSLELSAGSDSIREFLAVSKPQAPQITKSGSGTAEPTGSMRFVAPILAERALRARGAQLPGSWGAALRQITPFPASGRSGPGFAATFLVGDTLGAGGDNEGYALFMITLPSASQTGYDTAFVDFRDYPKTGKQAARVVDYLDWTRDDQVELLLRVFGVSDSWFEVVAKGTDGKWRTTLHGRCDQGSRSAPSSTDFTGAPGDTGVVSGSRPEQTGAVSAKPAGKAKAPAKGKAPTHR